MAELTARCPACNRIGKKESAAKKCPDCGHEREACFVVKCDGSSCAGELFHRDEGIDFWCFEGGWVAPGVMG